VTPPGYAALHGGEASAVLLPALGGKIRDVTLGGRQWLWHNPQLPFATADESARFDTEGDSGGFDDCFPTVAAGTLPTWVRGAGDLVLADHGDLWRVAPETTIATDADGHSATCRWQGARWPWQFTRTVRVLPSSEVRFEYEVHNDGANAMPFLWAGHALFPLTALTRLLLPDGAKTRVWAQHGADLGAATAEHHWPRVRSGAVMADLSAPWTALKVPYACKLFVELPPTECVIGIAEGEERLEMVVDGRAVPFVGVWINREAWTPFAPKRSWLPWRRRAVPYANVALEPCLGAPDGLADAVASWDAAAWLAPATAVRWEMTWRAGA
jgi:galactose mutarotase-like enzyme